MGTYYVDIIHLRLTSSHLHGGSILLPIITLFLDPNFFEETSMKADTDCLSLPDKKVSFKRYHPTTTKEIREGITFSFGTVRPYKGDKDATKAGEYDMRKWPHGIAVVINNKKFEKQSEREGTSVDDKNLIHAFLYLGYIVEVHRDRTAEEIKDIMEKIKVCDHSIYDSFICCIMSHGKEGHILGSDDTGISLNDLASLLNGNICKTLLGKPKIFIIQACRGKQKEKGMRTDGDAPVAFDSDGHTVSEVADIFFGYATPLGYVSWRNPSSGSWYISELCHSLAKYACCSDLETITKITCRRVGEEYANKGFKQTPERKTRLTKDVFFF